MKKTIIFCRKRNYLQLPLVPVVIVLSIFLFFFLSAFTHSNNGTSKSVEAYTVHSIQKVSFEEFNESAGDCCNRNPNASKVFALRSEVAHEGAFSLMLVSLNQCACASVLLNNFSTTDSYLVSFYYKGENPRYCSWFYGDDKCNTHAHMNSSEDWLQFTSIETPSEKTTNIRLFFYADSNGSFKAVNYYDNLEVFRLEPFNSSQLFSENESYVIEIDQNHYIKNGEIIQDNTYFVKGIPNIKRKIPETQIFLISLIFVVVALIFYHIKRRK